MSYILEALKRAERERRAGTSSSLLDEVPSAGGSSATPAWQRWATPAAIAALAAAIVTYLIVEHGTHPALAAHTVASTPATAPTTASATAASAPTRLAPAPPSAPVETTAIASAPTIEDDGRISSLKDLDDKPASIASSAQNLNESGDSASSSSPAAHASPQGKAEETSASDADADGPRAIVDPTAATTERAAPAKPAAPAPTENLREMPDDFRAGFPAITVDVHAYAEDAAQRFVLIGGKRYHENDTLPQGPKIFAIVPEGIVFDWQGERVLYALAGH